MHRETNRTWLKNCILQLTAFGGLGGYNLQPLAGYDNGIHIIYFLFKIVSSSNRLSYQISKGIILLFGYQ